MNKKQEREREWKEERELRIENKGNSRGQSKG